MKGRQKFGSMLIVSLCLLLGSTSLAFAGEKKEIQFFFENVCASCREEEKFYELFNRCISPEEKQSISYEIRTHNIFVESEREIYEKLREKNGIEDKSLPILIINGQWVSGYDKIETELHKILIDGENGEAETPETETLETETPEADSETTDSGQEPSMALPEIPAEDGEQAILLFTTYSCADCGEVKRYLEETGVTAEISVTECSIGDGSNVALFKELLGIYGIEEKDGRVPAVFAGEQALIGKEEIRAALPGLIENEKCDSRFLKEKLSKLQGGEEVTGGSMGALAAAGLLAGFNPCAISMLLMLFSILLTGSASVLKNGALYLLGKYLTYFGLGAGICFAASKVDQSFLTKFGNSMNLVLVGLFLLAAVMNFLDFLNVRKEEYGKVRMQLPRGLRRFNHKLLKKAEHMEGVFLGLAVLGLGIAVSLGEFFCTGQIYMASILYLLQKESGQFWLLARNLLVYVTAMSVPAAVIMGIIHRTRSAGRVSDFMLEHMGAVKLLNSLLFLCYALWFLGGIL